MKTKLVLSLVLALLVFTFITQNAETVRVAFLAWSIEISIVVLVFIILGIGVIIGWSLSSYLRFVSHRKRSQVQDHKQVNEATVQGDKDVHE